MWEGGREGGKEGKARGTWQCSHLCSDARWTWRSHLRAILSYSLSNSTERRAAASCTQWPLGLNLGGREGGREGRKEGGKVSRGCGNDGVGEVDMMRREGGRAAEQPQNTQRYEKGGRGGGREGGREGGRAYLRALLKTSRTSSAKEAMSV